MPIADRMQDFGTTVFAEFTRLAAEHRAINLGQGFPDFDGPELLRDVAAEALRTKSNQYAPTNGIPALTGAIAVDWRTRTGIEVDPGASVTVTCGCTEAIAASLLGLLNPGDEVILFEPFYDSYRACIALAGATPRFVTLRWPDFRFDPDELRAAIGPRTRAILVNTPHNPTGRVFDADELHLIASLCMEHDLVAITDEVYEHLVYDGEHTSLATLPDMAERTIVLSSLGKTFSLTGWKIGWAIAPPALSAAVRAAHQFLTFAISPALQHGAVAALHSPASYYHDLRGMLRSRRDLLIGALEDIGLTVSRPAAGYFVMADHGSFDEDDVTFCTRLIRECGVAAIPPSFFYANPEHGRALVRFAFCKQEATLREAAARLAQLH
ncbi:MAG: aminotransferase class I/II-fold pyridoxal phosphate-dependent enzyme [Planctomycetota bacterium]